MDNFTPVSATVGGLILGLASTLLWMANGRIAGISGIVGGVLPAGRGDLLWRILFVIGLPLGAIVGFGIGPIMFGQVPAALPTPEPSPLILVVAGILVGVGTRLGRGCTSGHGICGLGSLSARSFVAVLTFMGVAALTVFVTRHVI